MVDTKEVIGWMFGASIAVAWISFAILGAGNMMFLVVAIDMTILLGTLSGGFISLSKDIIGVKEMIGWVSGAVIPVAWISWAILCPGNMVGLVVALGSTIIFGTLAGGLLALSKKED